MKEFWRRIASMETGRCSAILGYILYHGSVILGLYLLLVTFGINPMRQVFKILDSDESRKGFLIFLQFCKFFIGWFYTLGGVYVIRVVGSCLMEGDWVLRRRHRK